MKPIIIPKQYSCHCDVDCAVHTNCVFGCVIFNYILLLFSNEKMFGGYVYVDEIPNNESNVSICNFDSNPE